MPTKGNGKKTLQKVRSVLRAAEMVQRSGWECGMNKVIDLRSDTVTRPTPGMLTAMSVAEVGR